ncbi:MAG TPA: hypothetical protein VKB58_01450 [Terriglobales bacterium]|jgi:hypothetical protein|nr:hypothetical protein [Terriglobales bacterium]
MKTASFVLLTICWGLQPLAVAQQTQTAVPQAVVAGSQRVSGLMPVSLSGTFDSKKVKEGQEVDAKVASLMRLRDGTVIPSGMKVVGHVTQATSRAKGDANSSLQIVFESIALPDGKSLSITGMIEAVGPDVSAALTPPAGVGYTDRDQAVQMNSIAVYTPQSVPLLNQESRGVVGIRGLYLDANGLLTSDAKSVKLDRGYQILLRVKVPAA